MTIHAVKCKFNGRAIAAKLYGGWCRCPSSERCYLKEEWDREDKEASRTTTGRFFAKDYRKPRHQVDKNGKPRMYDAKWTLYERRAFDLGRKFNG